MIVLEAILIFFLCSTCLGVWDIYKYITSHGIAIDINLDDEDDTDDNNKEEDNND